MEDLKLWSQTPKNEKSFESVLVSNDSVLIATDDTIQISMTN